MSRPLISIIVPVYNVERYISRCIDSILAQTYENIEIILVDDGSTDDSGRICEQYVSMDPRIKTIHKQNGGLSDARNVGIQAALGEYCSFVDSDDYIAEDYIAYLYHLISVKSAQISICGYHKVYESSENTLQLTEDGHATVCSSENALYRLLYQKGIIASAWGKLFHRDLFLSIQFPIGRRHEDVAVMYKLFDDAKVIAIGSAKKYFYLQRQGSIVNSKFDVQRMDYIQFTQECIGYMRENYLNLERAAVSRHFSACFELLAAIGNDKKEFPNEYDSLIKEIKTYRSTVLFDSGARAINRIAAMGTFISITVVRKLCCMIKHP